MRNTIRTIIAIPLAIIAVLSFSACQAGTSSDAPKAQSNTTAPAEETAPPSLDGTWTAEGFVAEIAGDSIEINIVSGDTKSLYWKGTFPQEGGDKVVSQADTEALAASLLGSQDASKTFNVPDADNINFEMSMMGTTTIVRLKR